MYGFIIKILKLQEYNANFMLIVELFDLFYSKIEYLLY